MVRELRINEFATVRCQTRERAFLVGAHETGITNDIGAQDRRERAFDARSIFDGPRIEDQ